MWDCVHMSRKLWHVMNALRIVNTFIENSPQPISTKVKNIIVWLLFLSTGEQNAFKNSPLIPPRPERNTPNTTH